MLRLIFILFLFLPPLFQACAHSDIGRPVNHRAAQKIEIGKTTEAEVIALLGQPLKIKTNPDGSKIYGYMHIQSKAYVLPFCAKGRATGDKVLIHFNKEGVVTAVDSTHMPE